MKKLLVVLVLVVFASLVFAEDAIYLKNGKILKGKITEEGGDSISIEMKDEWKEVNRKDIKKIERDKEEQEEKTETKKKKRNDIGGIRLGLDVSGNHTVTVDGASVDTDVNTGITLAVDGVWPVSKSVGLGFGTALEMPRALAISGAEDAWFMFWPYYGVIQITDDYKKKGISPYGVLQLGFDLFLGSDKYKGPGGSLYPGLYLGIGGGITSKRNGFQAELLYAIHNGSGDAGYEYAWYDPYGKYWTTKTGTIAVDVKYTTLRLSVGYNF